MMARNGFLKTRIGILAGTVIGAGFAVAAAVGTFSQSTTAHAAVIQSNPVSSKMITAMTAGNGLHISTLTTDGAQPKVATSQTTAEQAALQQVPTGSKVLGASLANAAMPLNKDHPQLVWLISIDPAGGIISNMPPPRLANFYIAMVRVSDGKLLMASSGRSPQLPDLPKIARS